MGRVKPYHKPRGVKRGRTRRFVSGSVIPKDRSTPWKVCYLSPGVAFIGRVRVRRKIGNDATILRYFVVR